MKKIRKSKNPFKYSAKNVSESVSWSLERLLQWRKVSVRIDFLSLKKLMPEESN